MIKNKCLLRVSKIRGQYTEQIEFKNSKDCLKASKKYVKDKGVFVLNMLDATSGKVILTDLLP